MAILPESLHTILKSQHATQRLHYIHVNLQLVAMCLSYCISRCIAHFLFKIVSCYSLQELN